MNFLAQRAGLPELMDDPTGDTEALFTTLTQFELINRLFSRNRYLAKKLLIPHMQEQSQTKFTLFDLGAGGCDFGLWLVPYAKARGIEVEVHCFDSDPRVVEYARVRCAKAKGVRIIHDSALNLPSYEVRPDYIFANHLLHHLSDREIPVLISAVEQSARLGFILNDLKRSKWSYVLFGLFASLVFWKSYARADGLLSIRKGFTAGELRRYLDKLEKSDRRAEVRTLFPGRVVLLGFQ